MNAEAATSPALLARRLLRAARVGTLATQHAGQPFASLVTPATAPDGTVLLLLSALSAHTSHLRAEPRCALLVAGEAADANPQTTPRVTLIGTAVPEPDATWRAYWLARHPCAVTYAAFTDFSVWRITAVAGHLVSGFARAYALSQADLAPPAAALAAVAAAAPAIIAHCNSAQREALGMLAQRAGRTGSWHMFGVDPDGFDLRPDGLAQGSPMPENAVLRIAFDRPVSDAGEVRAALLRLAGPACVV